MQKSHANQKLETVGKGEVGIFPGFQVSFGSMAFTMIELLVVVAIIGVLAGIVLAAAGGVQKKAARDQTQVEIKAMMAALERYRAMAGSYPIPSANPSATALFTALTNQMSFRTNQISGQQILDPYGYPYWYRLVTNSTTAGSGTVNMASESAEIWSVGPNGKSGLTNSTPNRSDPNNRDDLTSWN